MSLLKTGAVVAIIAIGGTVVFLSRDELGPIASELLGVPSSATDAQEPVIVDPAPARLERYILLDPTTSTDTSFRDDMKAAIVAAVATYVPPKPEIARDGVPAVAGLHLVVHLVGSSPLQYGAPGYEIDIPGIPGLPVRPSMSDPGALDPGSSYEAWADAEAAWSDAYDAALAAAIRSVATLEGIDLELDELSAVTAGVVSLSLLVPAGADAALMVMSDLDENRGTETSDLHGMPITVIQPDPAGSMSRWTALFDRFGSWAASCGAGPITQVRPEASGDAIAAFFGKA